MLRYSWFLDYYHGFPSPNFHLILSRNIIEIAHRSNGLSMHSIIGDVVNFINFKAWSYMGEDILNQESSYGRELHIMPTSLHCSSRAQDLAKGDVNLLCPTMCC